MKIGQGNSSLTSDCSLNSIIKILRLGSVVRDNSISFSIDRQTAELTCFDELPKL